MSNSTICSPHSFFIFVMFMNKYFKYLQYAYVDLLTFKLRPGEAVFYVTYDAKYKFYITVNANFSIYLDPYFSSALLFIHMPYLLNISYCEGCLQYNLEYTA